MIDTNAIRAKATDVAVTGELTADYKSRSNADFDLNKMGIIPSDVSEDEIPYELKDGWKWVRVVDLGADSKNSFADGPFGSNLKREHYTTDRQVRIIQLSNVGELGWKNENEKYTTFEHLETIKRSEVEAGNIVIAKMMPAGRAIIVPEGAPKYVLSSDCVKFVPNDGLNAKYLCYSINSQMFRNQVLQDVHGIGRERTSLSKLKSYLLPIPPVDEQAVIVDRIDAIYDLLKDIDELQRKYESDLVVLKGKIIDAGIRGKLTEQLHEDGDAEDLYAQILNHKEQLIKKGKIKKGQLLQDIAVEDVPFEIPANWKWVRLNDLGGDVDVPFADGPFGSNLKREHYTDEHQVRIIQLSNIGEDGWKNENEKYTTFEHLETIKRSEVKPGDIVIAKMMPAGRAVIVPPINEKFVLSSDCVKVVPHGLIDTKFLLYAINSSVFRNQVYKNVTGVGRVRTSLSKLKTYLVPLPPYEEQKRISNKIEELFEIVG